MRLKLLGLSLMVLAAATGARAAGDEAPAWLQQAARISVPTYEKDVPAVVLYKEQEVTLSSDGKITTLTTFAVRIITREGRSFAEAGEVYLTKTGKIRELNAWLIRPNGFVKKYGKDQTIDRISDPNDVYDEYRVKVINASIDADAGVVFGYQSLSEERPIFHQDVWRFQNRLPTLTSRYRLSLPNRWQATGIIFNHAKVEPIVNGSNYTWEMHNLEPIKPEPASPTMHNLAPFLAVNYFPADSALGTAGARTFETWAQVSRWGAEMHDPLAVADESVAAKARELTANSKSELDRIRAIARFVQGLQYISIVIGVGRGNGYRPHPAAQVLAKAYGDCKDKANLMRTMLKIVGITAFPVFIYSGDPTLVREEWPSPTQFNHVIIAVKVSDETQAATVITHPSLGRLLIFDATDEVTPLGDLPEHEQGSLALIAAGESGALLRMPITPPESNVLDRKIDASLSTKGSLTATIQEKALGSWASNYRREFRNLSRPDYTKAIERWIAAGARAATVSRVLPPDDSVSGRFTLYVYIVAPSYGQLMQGRLLVFKPAIVSRRDSLDLTAAKRKHPIVLTSLAYAETVTVKLPADFDVDEMPDAVKLNTSFGTYATTYEVKDGQLVFTRKLVQRAGTIPVEQYNSVRTFFEKIRAAELAPMVLARK
jgi:transglutaminase-like putative cysteine protease